VVYFCATQCISLSYTVSEILALISQSLVHAILQNFILRVIALIAVTLRTKFEMFSFTRSKDVTGAPKLLIDLHDGIMLQTEPDDCLS